MLPERFTALEHLKCKYVTFQVLTDSMVCLSYHEALSKAAQVPDSLGSLGCVHLLLGQLLFSHSLESYMVCQHLHDEVS